MSMQRHKYVELIKRELDELKIKRISDAELTIIMGLPTFGVMNNIR